MCPLRAHILLVCIKSKWFYIPPHSLSASSVPPETEVQSRGRQTCDIYLSNKHSAVISREQKLCAQVWVVFIHQKNFWKSMIELMIEVLPLKAYSSVYQRYSFFSTLESVIVFISMFLNSWVHVDIDFVDLKRIDLTFSVIQRASLDLVFSLCSRFCMIFLLMLHFGCFYVSDTVIWF